MKDARIRSLTLKEKAALLTGQAFFLSRGYPEYGIRSLRFSDGPHGLRRQASAGDHLGVRKSLPSTCFPTASLTACSFDRDLLRRLGHALGREAASMDVDVLLGPGLNIKRNPLCGRNFEYFSEDAYLAGTLAASMVDGIQETGVSACVKHFALNNRELRRATSDSIVDERTLREIYLYGFELAVKNADAVMTSYNRVNGTYADENVHLLREILRGEWGFEGAVITDWGSSNTRVGGLAAGSDLEMPKCRYGADDLVQAVQDGTLPESLLDESIERLLRLAERSENKDISPYDAASHRALAREAAQKSVVLLENDGVLPLKGNERAALIGDFAFKPRYQGAGSSTVNPTALPNAEEALKKAGVNLVFKGRGFRRFGKRSRRLKEKAVKGATRADVMLFFAGLDEDSEAEGVDRRSYGVPENQKEVFSALIAAGKKVVVVLSCGCAVETAWTKGAAAVLWAGLAGQEGAYAVADVLCGAVNPSGKLAESWAEKYRDFPSASYFPQAGDSVQYREGLFVGYRYFTTAGGISGYPFGYGLSYTSFCYESARIEEGGVTVRIKNTGKREGSEVVQLYVAKKDSAVPRPARELKGYARIPLAAGESGEVFIPLDGRAFQYFDTDENAWQVEAGTYELLIGASSEDIRLRLTVEKEGKTPKDRRKEFPCYTAGRVKEVSDEEFSRLLGAPLQEEKEKNGRITVHLNTTVGDLSRARGWTGRAFSALCRVIVAFVRAFGSRGMASTMSASLVDQPLRGLAKFAGWSRKTLEGFVLMFNGKFFAGLSHMLGRKRRKTS